MGGTQPDKTVNLNGSPAQLIPSSYSDVIALDNRASPEEMLNCLIASFYRLGAALGLLEMVGGNIYQFDYCFRDGYETSPAFLITSEHGGNLELFMLIGVRNEFAFIGYDEIAVIDGNESNDEDDEESDEIDFSMF